MFNGVQQGDVLGPALFAIALQPVVERLRDLGLVIHMWYLDDGILVGTVEAIKAALLLLKEHLPWRGLDLNLAKCKLFGPGASTSDPAFEGIPRYSLDQGTVVLGVPIGTATFVEDFVSEVCAKLSHMADRIGLLKSNIARFLLLRACFGACRVNHPLRSLPFQHGKSLAEKASVIVRNTLEAILGSPLPDICFLLACLPVRRGGLGLQDPRATDISSLVGTEEGPFSISSRSWTLLARLRLGQPLDALDSRFCPGCGAAMDCYGDHVLSCHKLGIYARHNEVRNELASICGDLNLLNSKKAQKAPPCARGMSWCMDLPMYHLRSTLSWCTLCKAQLI